MALLHEAELSPSKLELLAGWAPHQEWFRGSPDDGLVTVGAFRFDDPAGEVGVETLLVRSGDGPVLQIPVTYRGAPMTGGEAFLIGEMHHSALGDRWVYDAVGDPVYLQTTAAAALTGGHEAELFIDVEGERVQKAPTAQVIGSGSSGPTVELPSVEQIVVRSHGVHTVANTDHLNLVVLRVPGEGGMPDSGVEASPTLSIGSLEGTWSGQSDPQTLVIVTAH